jgi:hypothetical protein
MNATTAQSIGPQWNQGTKGDRGTGGTSRLLACLLGGGAGGGAAWGFATTIGGALHCSWLGTATGILAALLGARALAGVDADQG